MSSKARWDPSRPLQQMQRSLGLVAALWSGSVCVSQSVQPAGEVQTAARNQEAASDANLGGESVAMRVLQETLRSMRSADHAPIPDLARDLEEHVARELDAVFGILRAQRVPAWKALPEQALSELQLELLLEATARLPRQGIEKFVQGQLESIEESAPAVDVRRASIQLLGCTGTARALRRVIDIAAPLSEIRSDEDHDRHPAGNWLPAFRSALASILMADSSAYGDLRAAQRDLPPLLVSEIVGAIGDAKNPKGVALLDDLMEWLPEFASQAMGQLRRLGPSRDPNLNLDVVERLRGFLSPERVRECGTAALALAEFDDLSVVEDLIALLETEDPGLRGTLHWSLQRLTGSTLPADHASWSRWFEDEQRWMIQEKARAFHDLQSTNPGRVSSAMARILPHVLARKEFTEALEGRLMSSNPTVRVLVCRTLGELSRTEVIAPLLGALRDPSSLVRNEAVKSLGRRTGIQLPRDPLACFALLEELGYGDSHDTDEVAALRNTALSISTARTPAVRTP